MLSTIDVMVGTAGAAPYAGAIKGAINASERAPVKKRRLRVFEAIYGAGAVDSVTFWLLKTSLDGERDAMFNEPL